MWHKDLLRTFCFPKIIKFPKKNGKTLFSSISNLKFPISLFWWLLFMIISVSINHRKRATFQIFVKVLVVFVHFVNFFSPDAKMFSTVAKGLAKNLLIPKKNLNQNFERSKRPDRHLLNTSRCRTTSSNWIKMSSGLDKNFYAPERPLYTYRLDAISQGPKNSGIPPNPLPLPLVMDMHASKTLCTGLYKS